MMDAIAIAVVLIGIGVTAAAVAWLGRRAGLKAIALLLVAAALGIGGGLWMLWP